jgi:hypothetical protein
MASLSHERNSIQPRPLLRLCAVMVLVLVSARSGHTASEQTIAGDGVRASISANPDAQQIPSTRQELIKANREARPNRSHPDFIWVPTHPIGSSDGGARERR